MFATTPDTVIEIGSAIVMAGFGFLAKHLAVSWKPSNKQFTVTLAMKLELLRQIRAMERSVQILQRRNNKLQALVDSLVKENAELKADRQVILNSVALLKAKIERLTVK
jgi:seryl-tRNA synthetase